ncbi:Metallo-dependent phosphatase [Massarina eburnea CBS 473.64]|uniref:Metallo-dependent phosphatase n=1 Tax=Massarina eburnea CBS 473.64 TaxID=1395130 RepID=A0A6A6RJN9_9PLEO|nr:Metallo-dependent phosphatase [Massarina eburnea CBS 473.64]
MISPTPVRFLIISDTHGEWPYNARNPAPKVDVVIHCGDLTQCGGLSSVRKAIEDISSVDANLRLVIAGNHDLELDTTWCREFGEPDDAEERQKIRDFLDSQNDVVFLDEGKYKFNLTSGASFTLYASPYTPAFGDWAFMYKPNEDHFNETSNYSDPSYRFEPHPISDDVDIVMTHGPPYFPDFNLDTNSSGQHCGCPMLAKAIQKVKPRMHCFGHIHEGRGTAMMRWEDGTGITENVEAIRDTLKENERKSLETLMVNAAMHGNATGGVIIDMDF